MSTVDYSALGFKNIIARLDGPVLIVLMNRAKDRNTWNRPLPSELRQVFELADRDDRVKAVVMSAEHTAPAYCAGVDISEGWSLLWDPEETKEGPLGHRDSGGKTSLVIYRCRKITIAAVNGHAAGVGMTTMQLPFDFRFIWKGAKLTFPFVRRGIVPEATSSYLLARLIGQSRAMSLILSGSTISADSHLISSLYHQIFPTREEVLPAAVAFAHELASKTSQVSIAVTKGLIQHPGDSIEENHLLDSRAIRALCASHDGEEGVRAFMEKREPKFTSQLSKDLGDWFPWWRSIRTDVPKTKL